MSQARNQNHFTTNHNSHQPFQINHNIFLNPRYYRLFALGSFAFLLAFLASAILTPVSSSSAADPAASTIDISNQYNGRYLSFSAQRNLGLNISAVPEGTISAVTDNLSISTNVGTGYKLSIATTTSDIYNIADIDKVSNHFSPVNGTIASPSTLGANTWGFKLATVSAKPSKDITWSAVPTDTTVIRETDTATTEEGETIPISYGFAVDTTLPAGTYQAEILYTVYAEYAEEFPTMQDFTIEDCNNMQTNEITTLTDSRDGKSYRITKYADNNCWMSQNLALDPVDDNGNNRTLTTSDSDISTAEIPSGQYTFPDNTLISSGTTAVNDKEQIYNAYASRTTASCNTDSDSSYCLTSNEPYGNYYNWLAATLGQGTANVTGEVNSSVCPKGWKLPTSGDEEDTYGQNAPDKSYAKLMYSVLGFNSAYAIGSTGGTLVKKAQQSPLSFSLAGTYYNAAPNDQGINGIYWSRTAKSDANAHGLYIYSNGNFHPQGDSNKKYGFAVRCVFDPPIEDGMNMQDVTQFMCNNLNETTSAADNRKTLVDSRDNKIYKVAKLADGNCWMVQNLALDGTDSNGKVRILTPTDSDVTENRTLAANSTSGMGSTEVKIYSGVANDTSSDCGNTIYCIVSDIPYGNLYNWYAATATTGTAEIPNETSAPDSICPKGWQVPAFGTYTTDKTFNNLMYATLGVTEKTQGETYVKQAQQAPLYYPLSGYFGSSGYTEQRHSGYYWTSTSYDNRLGAARTFFFSATSSDFYITGISKSVEEGHAVRCVFAGS